MSFTGIKKQHPDHWELAIQGAIDENADFSQLGVQFENPIHLELGDLEYINSAGIGHWVRWQRELAQASPSTNVYLYNCPKIFIDQLNMIQDFLVPRSIIKSFKVPFFCEHCDKDEIFVFRRQTHYQDSSKELDISPPNLRCSSEECCMEMDVVPEKYFSFLKRPPSPGN